MIKTFIYYSFKFIHKFYLLLVSLVDWMNDNRGTDTSQIIRNVILEVAFNGPHVSAISRHDLCCQSTFAAALNLNEVCSFKARLRVPHVNIRLSLVAEEHARLVVRSEQDDLKAMRFWTDINDRTGTGALTQVIRSDRKESSGLEVSEVEVATAGLLDEQDVKDIGTAMS